MVASLAMRVSTKPFTEDIASSFPGFPSLVGASRVSVSVSVVY
jgi:hypothetical protein